MSMRSVAEAWLHHDGVDRYVGPSEERGKSEIDGEIGSAELGAHCAGGKWVAQTRLMQWERGRLKDEASERRRVIEAKNVAVGQKIE